MCCWYFIGKYELFFVEFDLKVMIKAQVEMIIASVDIKNAIADKNVRRALWRDINKYSEFFLPFNRLMSNSSLRYIPRSLISVNNFQK